MITFFTFKQVKSHGIFSRPLVELDVEPEQDELAMDRDPYKLAIESNPSKSQRLSVGDVNFKYVENLAEILARCR